MNDGERRALLNALQYEFPLTPQPYHDLAHRMGAEADTVMERVRDLMAQGVVRAVRAVFEARRLGHRSLLVGAHVVPEALQGVAARVSTHPGVSHNYAREHHFNLWFTLTLPDDADVPRVVRALLPGVPSSEVLLLPALRVFKVDARSALGGETEGPAAPQAQEGEPRPFTPAEVDRRAVYALGQDLPVVERPFAGLAGDVGLAENELLERAAFYLEEGIMRRYGAALNHRRIGLTANGMTGWVVPPARVDAVGQVLAGFPQVSHCYERPVYPNWPYNLFTMIHGGSREEVERLAAQMSERVQVEDYAILYSTIEFKKRAVSFFAPWNEAGP